MSKIVKPNIVRPDKDRRTLKTEKDPLAMIQEAVFFAANKKTEQTLIWSHFTIFISFTTILYSFMSASFYTLPKAISILFVNNYIIKIKTWWLYRTLAILVARLVPNANQEHPSESLSLPTMQVWILCNLSVNWQTFTEAQFINKINLQIFWRGKHSFEFPKWKFIWHFVVIL